MSYNLSKLVAVSLVLGASLIMPAPTQAQSFPYRFCTETADNSQELTDAIAAFLDANYKDEVSSVAPVCYGQNPRMNNRGTWVYEAEFKGGKAVDVAVIESGDGRKISIKDSQFEGDENGWTVWTQLD